MIFIAWAILLNAPVETYEEIPIEIQIIELDYHLVQLDFAQKKIADIGCSWVRLGVPFGSEYSMIINEKIRELLAIRRILTFIQGEIDGTQ